MKRATAVMSGDSICSPRRCLFVCVVYVVSQHTFGLGFVVPLLSSSGAQQQQRRSHVQDDGSSSDFEVSELPYKDIPILYESDRILAVEKPVGIPHHDNVETGEFGILSVLRQSQQAAASALSGTGGVLNYKGRLYGVHRLDRVTSGILLLAKDAEMASTLTRAFRDGHVMKYYVGVSRKSRSKKKQGWVKGNMVRGRRKSWYLTRERNASSTSSCMAVTRFFTTSLSALREYAVDSNIPPRTCLLFQPHTGRTHQLRVAAKSLGLSLAGDPIYSDGFALPGRERTCLHASAIHIDLDEYGPLTIFSPPPFHHLWKDATGKDGFDDAVIHLFQKHCDCDSIRAKL